MDWVPVPLAVLPGRRCLKAALPLSKCSDCKSAIFIVLSLGPCGFDTRPALHSPSPAKLLECFVSLFPTTF